MGYIDYKTAITEDISELTEYLKIQTKVPLRDRCEVLLWLKSGKVTSMRACMELKNRNKSTGVEWWRIYVNGGLSALLVSHHKGRHSALDECSAFWDRLRNEGFSTLQEACDWLATHQQLTYSVKGLSSYFKRHQIKYKTGRPSHPNRSEEERNKYKKSMK